MSDYRNAYIIRSFTTGSPIDGTHWLPNKDMTKLWEVSDETVRRTGSPRTFYIIWK